MLSVESFNIFKKMTRLMFLSGAAPLTWIKSKNGQDRLVLKDSKTYKCFTGLHLAVLILYNVFMVYRFGIAVINQTHSGRKISKATLSVILQIVWNLLSYSIPLFFMVNNFKYWNDIPNFINGFLDFCQRFKANYVKNPDPNWKNGCETKLKTMALLGILISMINTILILKNPERAYFFTSIIMQDNTKAVPFLKKLPLILLQLWVWLSMWAHIYYYCFLLIPYAYATVFLLGQLKRDLPAKQVKTLAKLRQLRNFMRTYRQLQTLHTACNSCFQSFFYPLHKYIIMNIAIIGIYGSIKIPGPRAAIMCVGAGMCMLYLSMMFRRMGKLYVTSDEVLHGWRGEKGRYMRRFIKSSQPIRVEIGHYYYVTKTTVIVIWATVFNFTTNMLLSF